MILVQFIETTWYKNERGAQHGTLKNKLPEAARFPELPAGAVKSMFVLHTLKYSRVSSQVLEEIGLKDGKSLAISCA